MRIILVSDFGGGTINRLLEVYGYFSKKPEIILIRRKRNDVVSRKNLSKIMEIPLSVGFDPLSRPARALVALVRMSMYIVYVLLMLPIIASERPVGLVHAHFLLPQGLAGVLVSRATKAPLILTAAGSDVNRLATRTLAKHIIRHVLFPNSRMVVAVSPDLLRRLKTLGCQNAVYLPNCVEKPVNHTSLGNGNPYSILFVGDLIPLKRPHILIQAFHKIAYRVPDATLTIVGPGPMRQYLDDLITRLALDEKVRFTGFLQEKELAEIYRRSQIFVLPSSSEGMSYSLLEAMSYGKCVIVSEAAHSGIIRNGIEGLIFKVDDVDDLANKILWVFENPEKSRALSLNARMKCEREYSVASVALKLERLYAHVCS
jgi:glycosyltransferase involved in cell wall biosynthesis